MYNSLSRCGSSAWHQKMRSFRTYINGCPYDIENPVRIAVLDDGCDFIATRCDVECTMTFMPMIPREAPLSFHAKDWPKRHPITPYNSTRGHGNEMIKLIHNLCPKAHFFIARLDSNESGKGPTAASAARAVDWAVNRQVDIISMSWTINTTNGDDSELKSALERAKNSSILMFAAGSDEGNNAVPDPYVLPAAAPGVFRIVAADKHGQLERTVSATERKGPYCYAFPGEYDEDRKYSGSSVSTALASGFAGLLLHAAEISGLTKEKNSTREFLKRHENMAKTFDHLLFTGTRYVGVTRKFPDYVTSGGWDSVGKQELENLMRHIFG